MGKKRAKSETEKEIPDWHKGWALVQRGPLGYIGEVRCDNSYPIGKNDWAYVTSKGVIYLNPKKVGSPKEWEYVIAHCTLHLGFGHIRERSDRFWDTACDWVVTKFLRDSHIGLPPLEFHQDLPIVVKNEEQVYQQLRERPELASKVDFSMTGGRPDMVWDGESKVDYTKELAQSLQIAIQNALEDARYDRDHCKSFRRRLSTLYDWAREWFISSYPLLGAVAVSFRIVDDKDVIQRMKLSVAAVSPALQEIYINPRASLDLEEWKFVLAHEFLHAALRHDLRCEDRDPELWNIACDYVVNGWLADMKVGSMPDFVLHDPEFKDLSAESLYDMLYADIRRYVTGKGGDIIFGDCDGNY